MRKIVVSLIGLSVFVACGSSQRPNGSPMPIAAPIPAPAKSICLPSTCTPEPKATVLKPVEAPAQPEKEKVVPKCPGDMVFVKGEYCPVIEERCVKWLDPPSSFARCAKFDKATCKSPRVHKEYCIDREEQHDATGLPYGDQSWNSCKAMCESQGRRLCDEDEWNFACEGEEMKPYPYGYEYSFTICNVQRKPAVCNGKLCDHRARASEFPLCVSGFGVAMMPGNTDEWIIVPRYSHSQSPGLTMRSALKGGTYLHGRNRCRPKTTDHNETFTNPPSVGCRCCANTL